MASKYAHLRGKIPEQQAPPSEKSLKLIELQKVIVDRSFLNLTAEYNAKDKVVNGLKGDLKDAELELEAVELLIREQLDAEGTDGVRINGFTWSEGCEPYPSLLARDTSGVVDYFKENGMEQELELKASELASRLKNFVKEEALAGDLIIEEKVVTDDLGEEHTVSEVHSRIPGVKVFLKKTLSRVKSGK